MNNKTIIEFGFRIIWRIKETTRHDFFFYRHLSSSSFFFFFFFCVCVCVFFFFQIKPLHSLECKFISSTWNVQISGEIVFSSRLWKWNEHFCWIGMGTSQWQRSKKSWSLKCLFSIKIDNLRWLDICSCQTL